ncbi:MAG: glycosyltransferase [Acidobacteria bacterium]|nr:glycosyltransferase [Acidobacteriota bacterium]
MTATAARDISVVIHNPTLLERARTELSGVQVVDNVQVRGLGGARNSGVDASSGSIVAFLDDDAVAEPHWLRRFSEAYADENVLGVGGSIEPLWLGGRPSWFPTEFDWVVGCTYQGMPDSTTPVRNLIGCNMSYRRDVLDALGGFRLGYGCDETEFCIRTRRRWPGGILLYDPDARVSHLVPASRSRWSHFRSRCFFEGGSKAVVSWLVGSEDGLASERAYTRRVLPRAIGRGFSDVVARRDWTGLARAGTIVAGLTITTAGYVAGKLTVVKAAHARGWNGV